MFDRLNMKLCFFPLDSSYCWVNWWFPYDSLIIPERSCCSTFLAFPLCTLGIHLRYTSAASDFMQMLVSITWHPFCIVHNHDIRMLDIETLGIPIVCKNICCTCRFHWHNSIRYTSLHVKFIRKTTSFGWTLDSWSVHRRLNLPAGPSLQPLHLSASLLGWASSSSAVRAKKNSQLSTLQWSDDFVIRRY